MQRLQGLPSNTSIDAQPTGAIRNEQEQAASDRDVLEEHDHLNLVRQIAMEDQCRELPSRLTLRYTLHAASSEVRDGLADRSHYWGSLYASYAF